ncbi:MAG: PQQ-binding-like beta-propeller repeat protein [Candidatus Micrarchaeota archaeon]|nr:PQQ-binding-like beta-propeller repeat protein [Candidatus Micrarchaeota archaeon]
MWAGQAILVLLLLATLAFVPAHAASVKWNFEAGDYVSAGPAVQDGNVYFSSHDGSVYAVDALTGAQIWSFKSGGPVDSSPVISNGMLYFGSNDGVVYALDSQRGSMLWNFTTRGAIWASSPAVYEGVLYIGSRDNSTYALNAVTGEKIWSFRTGGPVDSSPAVYKGAVYFGSADGNVYALDANTGKHLWNFTTKGPIWVSSPAVSGDIVCIGSTDGFIYGLDPGSGVLKWAFKTGGWVMSSPSVYGSYAYAGSNDFSVYALESSTGRKLWSFETGGEVQGRPLVRPTDFGTVVYVSSNDGKVYALNGANGEKLWETGLGDWLSPPALYHEKNLLVVGSYDHRLYAISTTSCAIGEPLNGSQLLSGEVRMNGTAVSDTGMRSVKVRVKGGEWEAASGTFSWSYALQTSQLQMGVFAVECSAEDARGVSETGPYHLVRYAKVASIEMGRMNVTYGPTAIVGKAIRILVTDVNGSPLDGAVIVVEGGEYVSDETGAIRFAVGKPGPFSTQLTLAGYEPETVSINLEPEVNYFAYVAIAGVAIALFVVIFIFVKKRRRAQAQ